MAWDQSMRPLGAFREYSVLPLPMQMARMGVPPSVYREIQRAEQGGLITSRKISNTRFVRASTASP